MRSSTLFAAIVVPFAAAAACPVCCQETFTLFGITFDKLSESTACCEDRCSYGHDDRFYLVWWRNSQTQNGKYYLTETLDCDQSILTVSGGYTASVDELIEACPTFLNCSPLLIQSARFSESAASILITFDEPTDRGQQTSTFPCSEVGISLEVDHDCRFLSDSKILLETKVLLPGDAIEYDGRLARKADEGASAMCVRAETQSIEIEAPPNGCLVPKLSIEAPPSTSVTCGDLIVDARSTTGSGGRPLDFEWIVSLSDVVVLEAHNHSSLILTADFLAPFVANTLSISVRCTNFLGFTSNWVTVEVFVTDTRVPSVAFSGGVHFGANGIAMVTATSTNTPVDLRVEAAPCNGNSQIACLWRIGDDDDEIVSESRDPRQLYLSPNSLPANSSRSLSVTCFDDDAGTHATAFAELSVNTSPVTVRLKGGSERLVGVNSEVELDVAVTDLDATLGEDFEYEWTCTSANHSRCAELLLFESPSSRIFDSRHAGEYRVTVSVSGGAATTSTTIIVVANEGLPRVSLECLPNHKSPFKVNPTETLVCAGAIEALFDIDYSFSLAEGDLELDQLALTSVSGSLKKTNEMRTLFLVLPAGVLESGASYTFSLDATYSKSTTTSFAYAAFAIEVNSAPTSGDIQVSPKSGETPSTRFQLAANLWVDDPDDLPLVYEFFYANALGSELGLEYPVRGFSRASIYSSALLPPGKQSSNFSVDIFVRVMDTLGAATTSSTSAIVTSKSIDEAAEEALVWSSSWIDDALRANEYERALQVLIVSSTFINNAGVNCSHADNQFCASRNRYPCGEAGHDVCGDCIGNTLAFETISSAKNVACRPARVEPLCENGIFDAGETDVDCGGSTCKQCVEGSDCTQDADCVYSRCDDDERKCRAPLKDCPGDCSKKGVCVLIDRLTGLEYETSNCTAATPDDVCVARCVCDAGRHGERCEFSGDEWTGRLETQAAMFDGLGSVSDAQTPTTLAVSSQATTLASLCASNDALADEEIALRALTRVSELAQTTATPSSTFASAIVGSLSFILGKHRHDITNETIGQLLDHAVDSLSELVLVGAVPGQAPFTISKPNFKISSTRLDSFEIGKSDGGSVSLPVEDSPIVTIPSTCGGHDGVGIDAMLAEYSVNPFSSRDVVKNSSVFTNDSSRFSVEHFEEDTSRETVTSSLLRFALHTTLSSARRRSLMAKDVPHSLALGHRRRLHESDCFGEYFNLTIPSSYHSMANGHHSATVSCSAYVDADGTVQTASLDACGEAEELTLTCDGQSDATKSVACESEVRAQCSRFVRGAWNATGCSVSYAERGAVVCSCSADVVLAGPSNYAARYDANISRRSMMVSFERMLRDSREESKNRIILVTLGCVLVFFLLIGALGMYLDERDSAILLNALVDAPDDEANEQMRGHSSRFPAKVLPANRVQLLLRLRSLLPAAPSIVQGPRIQRLKRKLRRHADAEDARDTLHFQCHKALLASALPLAIEKNRWVEPKFKADEDRVAAVKNEYNSGGNASEETFCIQQWWSTLKVAVRTIATEHNLVSVLYVFDPWCSRARRCLVACMTVVYIFFAEALAHRYNEPGDICDKKDTKENCDDVMVQTGVFRQRRHCTWDPTEEKPCQERDPNAAQANLATAWEVFVCVLVALPFISAFKFVFYRYVAAPYKESSNSLCCASSTRSGAPSSSECLDVVEEGDSSPEVKSSVSDDHLDMDQSDHDEVSSSPPPAISSEDDFGEIKQETDSLKACEKMKRERELGLLLLHNLGIIEDSDPKKEERRVLLGIDGMSIAESRMGLKLPRAVGSRDEVIDWFALRATGATMRAVLQRRQELQDSLEDLLDGGESEAQGELDMPETMDFVRRKESMLHLIKLLQLKWACPPIDPTLPGQAVRAMTKRSSPYAKKMKPLSQAAMEAKYRAFARRTFERVRGSLTKAVQFRERHDEANRIVGASSLSRARALYQLMYFEYFDNEAERYVYVRLLEIDDKRELRHPSLPVSACGKAMALFAMALLIVVPVYVVIDDGLRRSPDNALRWLRKILLVVLLMILVIEPLRILIVNMLLPLFLVSKVCHCHDPCQIAIPFRTNLAVTTADLIPDDELEKAFAESRHVLVPRRLVLAPSERQRITRISDTVGDENEHAAVLAEPVVTSRKQTDAFSCSTTTDDVLNEIASISVEGHDPDRVDIEHHRLNRDFRKTHRYAWSDVALFKLEKDLDWRPPRTHDLAVLILSAAAALNIEANELIVEETLNVMIGIAGTVAATLLYNTSKGTGIIIGITAGIIFLGLSLLLYGLFLAASFLYDTIFSRSGGGKRSRSGRDSSEISSQMDRTSFVENGEMEFSFSPTDEIFFFSGTQSDTRPLSEGTLFSDVSSCVSVAGILEEDSQADDTEKEEDEDQPQF